MAYKVKIKNTQGVLVDLPIDAETLQGKPPADFATSAALQEEGTARENADNTLDSKIEDIINGDTPAGQSTKATNDSEGNKIISFYSHNFSFDIDPQTFVLTAQLLNGEGTALSTQTVDLPLESVVIGGSYDEETKEVALTLQSGSQVRFSVADLIDGLASQVALNSEILERQSADTSLQSQINDIEDGTTSVAKAVGDSEGNNIINTYARKDEIPDAMTFDTDSFTVDNNNVALNPATQTTFGGIKIWLSGSALYISTEE